MATHADFIFDQQADIAEDFFKSAVPSNIIVDLRAMPVQ